jgi:hypothetical protein
MKLSPVEKRALQAILDGGPGKRWDLGDIAAEVYRGRDEWPQNWRKSIGTIMRGLSQKVKSIEGYQIKKMTSIGRGKKAIYQLQYLRRNKRAMALKTSFLFPRT